MALGIQYTENFGRDKQPYLYNGKEFVEAHGQGFYVHLSRKYFVGDSVTISSTGKEDTILPITQKELWETWYDEKNFIYYHFWRITE